MDVRIKEINIQDSGPLADLQMELGLFNLIYGHNEQGKTFLVEFLIRSLFKNHQHWSLRSVKSRGKVVLSGLASDSLSLTPSSKNKMEYYMAADEPGLLYRSEGSGYFYTSAAQSISSDSIAQTHLLGIPLIRCV